MYAKFDEYCSVSGFWETREVHKKSLDF